MTDLYDDGTPEGDEKYFTEDEQRTIDARQAELILLENDVVIGIIRDAIEHHSALYKDNEIAKLVIEALNEDDNIYCAKKAYKDEHGAEWGAE